MRRRPEGRVCGQGERYGSLEARRSVKPFSISKVASEPSSRLAPRLDRRGDRSPRPMSFQGLTPDRPEPRRGYRIRRCLLKGCERAFVPARPQSRYCSEACVQSACRWRCWRASRRYRESESGRACRRAQHGRYRQRRRERAAAAVAAAAEGESGTAAAACAESREGQRPAEKSDDFAVCPCDRPGCYVVFAVRSEGSNRHFCSVACRLALRRVLDRESRYRRRRRERPWGRLFGRGRWPDTS